MALVSIVMSLPKVSVVIPAYNKADLTVYAVESVLKQTYSNVEIIVIDDGSTDQTRDRLAAFGSRIKYVHKENGGACSARNAGIRLAQGDYVAFLDCDDLYADSKIQKCVDYLQRHPNAGLVHTDAYFIDAKGSITGQYAHRKSQMCQGQIAAELILGNFICNSTPVIRKKCFESAGLFDESFFIPADWDMWLRVSEVAQVGYIDEPLTRYRVTDNYTFNRIEQAEREELIVIEKFFERHLDLDGRFKGQVLSNYYLRFAQCDFLKGNQPELKKKIRLSLRSNYLNIKAYAFWMCSIFARGYLRTVLTKKILRA